MTTSSPGFDYYLTSSAAADLDVLTKLTKTGPVELDVLLALLLADPTEDNVDVTNLSNGGADSVYQLIALGYSVFYQFETVLLIRVISIVPLPFDSD